MKISLSSEYAVSTPSRVCTFCCKNTLFERVIGPPFVTYNDGGPSAETRVVSTLAKMAYWKMGAYDGGLFDRSVLDTLSARNTGGSIPVQQVQDVMIEGENVPGFRIRIYTPDRKLLGCSRHPVLIWCHTGNFCLHNIESPPVDGLCRLLANHVPCIVVSVDYRLAPEHSFPAAVEDCYIALRWVAEHAASIGGDATRIAIGGDGAGGNLAASTVSLARDKTNNGAPPLSSIRCQVLITPILDLTPTASARWPSRHALRNAYMLNAVQFGWFTRKYLQGHGGTSASPCASPVLQPPAALKGLPRALVITAGHDMFRDEGEAYAQRLAAANNDGPGDSSDSVSTRYTRYTNSCHGFFGSGLDESDEALMEVCLYIGRALS
jgi:acetyl esterase